jgi:putative nucleotidyltransferase with HDIG domain
MQNILSKLFRRDQDHDAQGMLSLLNLAWFVEARDPYTGGHLWRVSRYAQALARDAGLSEPEVARISLGGFLHDLGKIGVPDQVLRKPGPLDDAEYAVMRTHPEVGLRLVSAHRFASWVVDAVGSHHERPDGRGYPAALSGDAIPAAARIVGVCDAFDAMTSARPYRKAMPIERALAIIEECAGNQFDAALARRFVAIGRRGDWAHIASHSDDGIPLLDCQQCGPILVRERGAGAGRKLVCRNCTGEYVLVGSGPELRAQPTGALAAARDLIAHADLGLLQRLLAEFDALRLWSLPLRATPA